MTALAVLASLPYLRALGMPLISDDYLVLALARKYGPVTAWWDLLQDPLYRNRATSIVLTYWLDRLCGLESQAHHLFSLLLHIVNCWLIFAFGVFPRIGWRLAGLAAGFFAIHEGHQEAVIWFSALPELLVFFFTLLALWLWLRWLAAGGKAYYAAALGCFVLALLSKESGVVGVALLGAPLLWQRRTVVPLLPVVLAAGLYTLAAFAGRAGNQHFFDGTFHVSAPFVVTIGNSVGRMLWIWGLVSAAAVLYWRPKHWKVWCGIALLWMVVTLLPYSFLTYMTRVPSRHTYLPSLGLALLAGAALRELLRHSRGLLAPVALGMVLVAHNAGYLWFYKHWQYVERAQPTEALKAHVRRHPGPVRVERFPYNDDVLRATIEVGAGLPAGILAAEGQAAKTVFSWAGD